MSVIGEKESTTSFYERDFASYWLCPFSAGAFLLLLSVGVYEFVLGTWHAGHCPFVPILLQAYPESK